MKTTHLSVAIAALLLTIGAAVGVAARADAALACGAGLGETCAPIVLAQSGCGAVAARVAAEEGGQVVGAPRMVERDGRTMCVITILIRDPDGERPPMRKQITVPAR